MKRGSREEYHDLVYFTKGDYGVLAGVMGSRDQLEEDLERMRVALNDHRRAECDEAESECRVARVVEACSDMVAAWERYDATSWPDYDTRQNMLKTYRDAARMTAHVRAGAQAKG